MPTISNGGNATIAVSAGQLLSVVVNEGSSFRYENPVGTTVGVYSSDSDLGPFTLAGSVKLTSINGPVVYELSKKPAPSATNNTDPLLRWRQKLASDPANAVVMFIGDSTSDETTSAQYMYLALRGQHVQAGGSLYGMTGDSSHIVSAGSNGITLAAWLADASKLAAVVSQQPDLIVASFLLNDVRLGAINLAQAQARLITLVETLRANVPGADILLRVPNPMITTNVSSLNYVQDSLGNINTAGLAQTYSTLIRQAYLSIDGRWNNVDVIDIQAEVFGTVCRATHPLMTDQLHPSPFSATNGSTTHGGGYVEIANAIARRIGFDSKAFKLDTNQYQTIKEGYIVGASSGSAFIDIETPLNVTSGQPAQVPVTTSSVLFVSGIATPISLSAASITRPFATNNIRITGLTGLDFTSLRGNAVSIGMSTPGATTGDRQIVAVNLPSIAAGAIGSVTVTVTGARTGALHDATAVVCSPAASFVTAGLVLLNCYPSANDTVTVVAQNPTGGAVDDGSANWAFWLVR